MFRIIGDDITEFRGKAFYPNSLKEIVMALNINDVKPLFFTETGLEWEANIHAFIQYYQAKILEKMMDQQQQLMTQLIQKVDDLDEDI